MNGMKVVVPVGEKIVFDSMYAYINDNNDFVLLPSSGPSHFWFYHGVCEQGMVVTLLRKDE
jgi:hypothetical protein